MRDPIETQLVDTQRYEHHSPLSAPPRSAPTSPWVADENIHAGTPTHTAHLHIIFFSFRLFAGGMRAKFEHCCRDQMFLFCNTKIERQLLVRNIRVFFVCCSCRLSRQAARDRAQAERGVIGRHASPTLHVMAGPSRPIAFWLRCRFDGSKRRALSRSNPAKLIKSLLIKLNTFECGGAKDHGIRNQHGTRTMYKERRKNQRRVINRMAQFHSEICPHASSYPGDGYFRPWRQAVYGHRHTAKIHAVGVRRGRQRAAGLPRGLEIGRRNRGRIRRGTRAPDVTRSTVSNAPPLGRKRRLTSSFRHW